MVMCGITGIRFVYHNKILWLYSNNDMRYNLIIEMKREERKMQQEQKRNQGQAKKGSSLGMLMAQRDKNRLKEQQKASYIELLKRPRSKEYLYYLAKTAKFCEQLAELEAEMKQLEQEAAREEALLPELENQKAEIENPDDTKFAKLNRTTDEATKTEIPSWTTDEATKTEIPSWITAEETKAKTPSWTAAEPSKAATPAWTKETKNAAERVAEFKEKQKRIAQLKQQIERTTEELKEARSQFEAQLPAPEIMLGMVWPGNKTEILMKYGVIAVPGDTWKTPKELLDIAQPKDAQEEKQWLKASEVFQKYVCTKLLIVEIYREIICVVYDDGQVRVIED